MKKIVMALLGTVLALFATQTASAHPKPDSAVAGYSAAELEASFSRVHQVLRGEGKLATPLDHRLMASVSLLGDQVKARGALSDETRPAVGGGWDRGGPYLTFNQFEQDLVIAGWGFALATAICLVPGVGQAACIVSGAVITVLTVFLSHNKKCPRDAKVYLNRLGQVGSARCV